MGNKNSPKVFCRFYYLLIVSEVVVGRVAEDLRSGYEISCNINY